jgi:hypothetical protein
VDALEKQLFWQGWDEEATAYLAAHGEREERERESFAGTLRDGWSNAALAGEC